MDLGQSSKNQKNLSDLIKCQASKIEIDLGQGKKVQMVLGYLDNLA